MPQALEPMTMNRINTSVPESSDSANLMVFELK